MKKNNIIYYIPFSITAAVLVIVLSLFAQSNINTVGWYDKLFLSVLIIIGCLFGYNLAFHPGFIKKYTKTKKSTEKNQIKIKRRREGHHPDCSKFQNHTILINDKKFCTGCLGLSIGCIMAIVLTIIYLNFDITWSSVILYFFIFIGLILIFLSYIETILPRKHQIFHIISNIALVLGFFLVTISIFEITGNKIYGLLGVILSALWLDTRIQLSNWRHSSICSKCTEKCKMYQ
jgi:hypothetical protein